MLRRLPASLPRAAPLLPALGPPCLLRFSSSDSVAPLAEAEADGPQRVRWSAQARSPPLLPQREQPRLVDAYLSEACMSKAERTAVELQLARQAIARHASDCGSSEVQSAPTHKEGGWSATDAPVAVAVLTRRVALMTEHLQAHPHDRHSRLGLMGMLANRRKLLQYLRRTDGDAYAKTIAALGLKDVKKE